MKKYTSLSFVSILGSVALLAACGTSHPNGPNSPSGGGSAGGGSNLKPIGGVTTSSTIALARNGSARLAFVADEDAKAILTMDPDTKKELASTSLGGTPGQVLVTADGRVLVSVKETSKVVAFQFVSPGAALAKKKEVATASEPIAMALTPDGATVLVSSGWGKRLTALDVNNLTPRFEVKLPREPRGVVVSDDGKTAFVSHAVGSVMSTVDLVGATHASSQIALRGPNPNLMPQLQQMKAMQVRFKKEPGMEFQKKMITSLEKRAADGRESCQGFALAKSTSIPNRVFGPQVLVDPGDPEQRAGGYGDMNGPPEVPAVAVIDEAEKKPIAPSMTSPVPTQAVRFSKLGRSSTNEEVPECLLPRAAAIDPTTQSLFVACFGTDSVVEYDATSPSPVQARRHEWNVGSGPTGIAIDPDKHQAVVFSQFDRSVTTIGLSTTSDLVDDKGKPPVERIALKPIATLDPQVMMGRALFHTSGDQRISADGRACASCHPDGRDDAITWATPDGPRRSIMLAGRVKMTPPYSWAGNANTVQAHLGSTLKRLRGQGLKSGEVDALVAYVTSMPAPPVATANVDAKKVSRGHDIFMSTEAACSTCHSGNGLTDGTLHDVGSAKEVDAGKKEFNTPSLHLISGTGPYFHDGRYSNLTDLLKQSSGTMGKTSHLSPADLDALQTYVETL